MSLPTPRFLYFDLGNVLLNFDHEIACRQLGSVLSTSPDVIRSIVFEGDLQSRYEHGSVSTEEFGDILCQQVGACAPLDAVRQACARIFHVNLPVVPIVGQLRAAGYRLGILSNTCEAHWTYVSQQYRIVTELFDVLALSYELRSMKPEPEIYTAAARMAAVDPREIFFVDDRADNVAAARAASFDAVPFTSARHLASDLHQRGLRFNY